MIPWVLLSVRVILGVVVLYYGVRKIRDLEGNADEFDDMGFKPGVFWGTVVAFIQFFGSVGLIFGILARLAAAFIGLQMVIGTVWKIKTGKPFTNYSYNLLIVTNCLVVIEFGPGALAILDLFSG